VRIAYFDCFSGISGDMTLGALIAAGVDADELQNELRKIPLPLQWNLQTARVNKQGIAAISVEVTIANEAEHVEAGHHGRSFAAIKEILHASQLEPHIISESIAVFTRIAEAEAHVHGVSLEEVHFHELGGVDAIIDIVGSIIGLKMLGVERCYCSALPWSQGFIRCEHGILPVPAPAVTELLRGAKLTPSCIAEELITPTGAGLLAHLTRGFTAPPPFKLDRVGWGAGKRNLDRPNVLRLVIGEAVVGEETSGDLLCERLHLLETNIDDMNPQHYEVFAQKAFQLGALDVYLTPIQMKKMRPGVLLSVLCQPQLSDKLLRLLFRETTTLGVRLREVDRYSLPREWVTAKTCYGEVRVKVAKLGDEIVHLSPEYEDCRRLAEQAGITLHVIQAEAVQAARVALREYGSVASRAEPGSAVNAAEASDPTSQKSQTAEKLPERQDSEERYRELFARINSAVVVHEAVNDGEDFLVKEMNEAAARMARKVREEVVGRTVLEVFPMIREVGLLDAFRRVWRTGEPEFLPLTHYQDGLREVWFESHIYRLDNGEVVAIHDDVTERHNAELCLVDALGDKELLFWELHHRVKNNLQMIGSLLRMQARKIDNAEWRKLFLENEQRIQSLALLHERLYQEKELGNINFGEYLKSLALQIMQTFNADAERILLQTEIETVTLPLDLAIPCGQIVTELITNALQHAFPGGGRQGEITVILKRTPEKWIRLEVSDNGVGLPAGFDPRQSDSFGVTLVNMLAEEQLGGRVEWSSEKGTRVCIIFSEHTGAKHNSGNHGLQGDSRA